VERSGIKKNKPKGRQRQRQRQQDQRPEATRAADGRSLEDQGYAVLRRLDKVTVEKGSTTKEKARGRQGRSQLPAKKLKKAGNGAEVEAAGRNQTATEEKDWPRAARKFRKVWRFGRSDRGGEIRNWRLVRKTDSKGSLFRKTDKLISARILIIFWSRG
jgi:hypothetical protein